MLKWKIVGLYRIHRYSQDVQRTHKCRVLQFDEIDQVHLQICQKGKLYGSFWCGKM